MTLPIRDARFLNHHPPALGAAFVFLAALSIYVSTLAPAQVPGDPSEYTFIPWIFGIAHPPGYGFFTLLAAVWQRLIPIGSVAYRTHLLAATAGALSATLVYAIVLTILSNHPTTRPSSHPATQLSNHPTTPPPNSPTIQLPDYPTTRLPDHLASLFAGLSLAFATDIWQHSIHINAHIVTLLLATTSVFLLVRWWATHRDRWLYAFSLIAGFSPAHHPLLVFAFPAYAAFILIVRPRILREPRTLLTMVALAALGLSVFLYYPLRSPTTPFGVSDIHSWDSFLHFVSAEGLRVNLFAFGLADQPTRFSIFANLLQLQYPLITVFFAVVGWLGLLRHSRRVLVLASLFFALLYAFVMNTIQDVMAYLMLPFMIVAVWAGVGVGEVMSVMLRQVFAPRAGRAVTALAAIALIGLPGTTALLRAPRISLREYTAGQDWVQRVYNRFEGKRDGAILIAPWEALTPLWVEEYTNNHKLDPRDVTLVYVAAVGDNPWLANVIAHFGQGPLYLADYRRQVVEGGLFRLRPDGGSPPLWRVVAPGDNSLPPLAAPLNLQAEEQVELLSDSLDRTSLHAGETAYLTLAMRAPVTPTHILMPYAIVGGHSYRWTTDSRVLSPGWQPGEVIVERYEIAMPFSTPAGDFPISIGVSDLTANRDLLLSNQSTHKQTTISIGTLHVAPPRLAPAPAGQPVLADFSAQVALVGASASANGQPLRAESSAWTQPLVVKPGQSIQVWLDWQALQQPLDSYKAFVHLIRSDEQLAAPPADFYTPLGGAFPTSLWVPKWIEGQRVSDPYTLKLPADLPPGDYRIEVGLYGLTSTRRVYVIGHDANLAGDRVILGPVKVQSSN